MYSKTNAMAPGKSIPKKCCPRMACIDIPDFLFQWVLQQQPGWSQLPLAIIQEEKPNAPLLLLNPEAQQAGLRVGMRYIEALSQLPSLRAQAISPSLRQQISQQMVTTLRAFSPQVAACPQRTGVFYAGVEGLIGLYPSWSDWIQAVRKKLHDGGYRSLVVVGFSQFGCLAVARHPRAISRVLVSIEEEQRLAGQAHLEQLELPLRLLQSLQMLGLRSLGEFLKLSSESILDRFGSEAYKFHRIAKNELWDPLQSQPEPTFWEAQLALDYSETSRESLLFLCKRMLDPLLLGLYRKKRALRSLSLELLFDDQSCQLENLAFSEATLDPRRILDLLRLRLDSLTLKSGVSDLKLCLEDVECPQEQLELFQENSRRELRSANRALDRVRAELGADSIVRAKLREGHLPVSGFCWEPLERLEKRPSPTRDDKSPIPSLRRFFSKPIPIANPGPERLLAGPFRLSGGWWNRSIERDYYYFQDAKKQWIWGYFDRPRKRWFAEGRLE